MSAEITRNANRPKTYRDPNITTEQHSIAEQILADRYAHANKHTTGMWRGMLVSKVVGPPQQGSANDRVYPQLSWGAF